MATNAIKAISFSRLRNAHHVGFHSKVLSEIDNQGSDVLGLDSELYARYKSAINIMQDIVNRNRASAQTVRMIHLDSERDNLFRKCIFLLKATTCGSPTALITADVIASLKTKIIDIYPASIADGGNQEETAKIRGFIKDMQSGFGGMLETLGIQSAITELKTVNDEYEEAFMERIRQQSAATNSSEARSACDDAFMQISFYLNSMANIVTTNPELMLKAESCNDIVDVLNTLISYYQSHYYSKASGSSDGLQDADVVLTTEDTEKTQKL